MEGLVSVVIPTYNRARYLAEAVESVLAQSYPHVEVIIIDDGSTDDTSAVAARYASKVRYVWQPNSERGAARNRGLRLARGEFVAFLDSDDVWMPDKLARDLQLFQRRPEIGLVYSDIRLMDAQGRRLQRIRRPGCHGWVTGHLLRENFLSIGAHLARTQAFRDAGGFREERELAGSEDWEAWVRLSTRVQFGYVASPTTHVRVHPDNSMSNAAGMERSMWHACALMETADFLTLKQRRALSRRRATIALVCAINFCCAGDCPRARAYLRAAIGHSPRVVLDPRYGYTWLHSMLTPRLSTRLRHFKQRLMTSCIVRDRIPSLR